MTLLKGVWLDDSRTPITIIALWACIGVVAHLSALEAVDLIKVSLHWHILAVLVIITSITITIAIVALVSIMMMVAIMIVAITSMMMMPITSMVMMSITSIIMI